MDGRTMTKTFTCRACGSVSEQRTGSGRPWIVCRECKTQGRHRAYVRSRPSLTTAYRTTLKKSIAASKRRQRKVASWIYLEGVCVVCKRTHWMDAQAVGIGQRTCGNVTCTQRMRYRTDAYKDGISHKNYIRRTAERAGDTINRTQVWERDMGMCHICGQATDRTHWHLDHVVPLARGGTHTWDNVSVSHVTCNLANGAHMNWPGVG